MVFIPQPNKDCRRSWFSPKASRGQTDGSEPSIRFQPILGARLTSTAVLELNIPTSTIYIPQAQTASMITGQATTIGANSARLDQKSTYSAAEGGVVCGGGFRWITPRTCGGGATNPPGAP